MEDIGVGFVPVVRRSPGFPRRPVGILHDEVDQPFGGGEFFIGQKRMEVTMEAGCFKVPIDDEDVRGRQKSCLCEGDVVFRERRRASLGGWL